MWARSSVSGRLRARRRKSLAVMGGSSEGEFYMKVQTNHSIPAADRNFVLPALAWKMAETEGCARRSIGVAGE